jgi:hypothetical protein
MHGKNGLNPKYTVQLWKTMVLPRMLSGAEVWALSPAETEPLELFQRQFLKQIQGLPDNAATAAVHMLTGVLPIAATLHIRTLTYFRQTVSNPQSVEYGIALQQLALKNDTSCSWYIHIERLAHQYDLPSPYEVVLRTPTKAQWKRMVKPEYRHTGRSG